MRMLTPAQLKKLNLEPQENGMYAAEDVDKLLAVWVKECVAEA